jgi:hypothetical protein
MYVYTCGYIYVYTHTHTHTYTHTHISLSANLPSTAHATATQLPPTRQHCFAIGQSKCPEKVAPKVDSSNASMSLTRGPCKHATNASMRRMQACDECKHATNASMRQSCASKRRSSKSIHPRKAFTALSPLKTARKPNSAHMRPNPKP